MMLVALSMLLVSLPLREDTALSAKCTNELYLAHGSHKCQVPDCYRAGRCTGGIRHMVQAITPELKQFFLHMHMPQSAMAVGT